MPETAHDLLVRLKSASAQMNWEKMTSVVTDFERLIADGGAGGCQIDDDTAGMFLDELRKKRRFPDLERAADALREGGQQNFKVQRQLVQALIDQGELHDALDLVEDLIDRTGGSPDGKEWGEARGLRGRTLKQMYVNAGPNPSARNQRKLADAIKSYEEVFLSDRATHHWHGINVVACAARAERDGVDVEFSGDWRERAIEIRESIDRLFEEQPHNNWNMWAWASAFEASIALDDLENAGRWLNRYIGCGLGDAFEYASTHRQLVEVWQLGMRGGPLSELLWPLRGALLKSQGGVLEVPWDEPSVLCRTDEVGHRRELQRTWGSEAIRDGSWFDRLLRRMSRVARIENDQGQVGTGFVVRGRELYPEWGDRRVVVTVAHVVDDPPHAIGIGPDEAWVNFTRCSEEKKRFRVRRVVWSNTELDASVLLPENLPDEVEGIDLKSSRKLQLNALPRPRLHVIGYPEGREIAMSLYDNYVERVEGACILYRSPTEHGNSGSPVLTEGFEAVAIHRAACRDIEANEGVRSEKVVEAIRADPPSLSGN